MGGTSGQYITGTERTHAVFPLPHPKTGEAALYMKSDTGEYLEMVKFREKQGSWMVNDCVEQDGSLYMAAPLDPLYLVVTLLRQAVGLEPWEDLVDCYPELLGVLNFCKGRLPQICDVVETEGEEEVRYRYNESLCLRWLANKVAAVAATLESAAIPVTRGQTPAKEDYMTTAFSIIADYVPEVLACALMSSLGHPWSSATLPLRLRGAPDPCRSGGGPRLSTTPHCHGVKESGGMSSHWRLPTWMPSQQLRGQALRGWLPLRTRCPRATGWSNARLKDRLLLPSLDAHVHASRPAVGAHTQAARMTSAA
ncbi:ribonuclease H2 subunit B-like isoform X2 [Haemaphysalis longicornis]